MRFWLTILMLTTTIAVSSAQTPLTIEWLSQPVGNRDSRFPSITANGNMVVFQVGRGTEAQIWQAVFTNQWQSNFVPVPNNPNEPLRGLHPVVSADGNHIAFASTWAYGGLNSTNNKQQIYVLDRQQNRIVPISVLWSDANGDSMRDTYAASLGNCIPVYISANGQIVVFLVESPSGLNVVDENGDGVTDTVNNPPQGWIALVHNRDQDSDGVYDEAENRATTTRLASYDAVNNLIPVSSVHVSANGRFIAYSTPVDPANPDERWRIVLRDLQSGVALPPIDNAFAPSLSDDGTYIAYLQSTNPTNYLLAPMDLVVQQIDWTNTPPTLGQPLRLSNLQPLQALQSTSGWGYSDWWGAATVVVDSQNPNVVYVAFHSWSSNLVDLASAVLDPQSKVNFYQGVPNIFLARFDFSNNSVNLWHASGPQWSNQRGLPISLELTANNAFRLPLSASLMPAISSVNGRQLSIVFQSLVPFNQNDTNGLWDIYIATVPLP